MSRFKSIGTRFKGEGTSNISEVLLRKALYFFVMMKANKVLYILKTVTSDSVKCFYTLTSLFPNLW